MRRTIECTSMLFTLLTLLVTGPLVFAQTVTINDTDHGWYNSAGEHFPNNVNYLVGDNIGNGRDVRNFFVFNLSGVTRPIASATLALSVPAGAGYSSADPSENYELHDVTTSIATLVNGTGGVGAHADLGSGVVYGNRTMTAADRGSVVEITLNSSAIAALDAATGLIGLGGSLTTLDAIANNEFTFGSTHLEPTVTQLRLTLGHEPPGNFNDDKVVDAADYVVWLKSDHTQAGYDAWRANFGKVTSGGGSSVPEPSTVSLLGIGAINLLGYRKAKSHG